MKLVYVAGPYRAPTPGGIAANVRTAAHYGARVAAAGFVPLVPHAIGFACDSAVPTTERCPDGFWLAATIEMLRRCDALLAIPGWEQSSGTRGEIAFAAQEGIPVVYVAEDDTFVDALHSALSQPR